VMTQLILEVIMTHLNLEGFRRYIVRRILSTLGCTYLIMNMHKSI